jgi:hypothetical protein
VIDRTRVADPVYHAQDRSRLAVTYDVQGQDCHSQPDNVEVTASICVDHASIPSQQARPGRIDLVQEPGVGMGERAAAAFVQPPEYA